ncbi:MAG TPA: SCO family protein [Thermoanaerobaculia bacterium]
MRRLWSPGLLRFPALAGLAGALALSALGAACRAREAAVPATAPTRAPLAMPARVSANARRYALKGVITAVAPGGAQITVAHEPVEGLLGASTTAFAVRDDPKVAALLRPGDRIEARLVVDGESRFLEEILTKGFVPSPAPGGGGAGGASPPPRLGGVLPEPNKGVAPGDDVPDFALIDQTGKTVRLSQFRGTPVAVTFAYTRCPVATACPMTMTKFAKIDAALAKKSWGELLSITVDPQNDTPEVLRDFASRIGADPKRWKFLTGDPKAVARAAESFGVLYYPDHGQIVHSQAVAVVDSAGKLAAIYYGEMWDPETVLRDLEKARNG